MWKKIRDFFKDNSLFLILFVILVALAIAFGSWPSPTWISQIFAVLAGACVTVVITSALLHTQSEEEEKNNRNLNIFKTKLALFQDFSKKLWAALKMARLQ